MRKSFYVLSLVMLFGACRTGAKSSTNNFNAPLGDSTPIVVGVDSIGITKGQVEAMLQPMIVKIAQQAQATGQTFDAVAAPLRRQAAAQILIQELMRLEVAKEKVVADPRKVDSIYNAIAKQYGDSAKFQEAMQQAGDNPISLHEKLAVQVAGNSLMEKILGDSLKVSPASVDSFYAINKDKLVESGNVRGRHILKLIKEAADTAKAHKAILAIAAKLGKGGDFAAIAKVESDDPGTKVTGGDLGWFDPKNMVPEFAAAVATLELGKISAPVRTQFGWHIIQIQDRKSGAPPALDSVRPMIIDILKKQNAEKVVPAWYRRLVKSNNVQFLDSLYREPTLVEEPKAALPPMAPIAPPAPAKK